MDDGQPNIYVLIARAENGMWLTPHEAKRIIHHYQNEVNRRSETISRIRETLNAFQHPW